MTLEMRGKDIILSKTKNYIMRQANPTPSQYIHAITKSKTKANQTTHHSKYELNHNQTNTYTNNNNITKNECKLKQQKEAK